MAASLFTLAQQQRIEEAVAQAEKLTSAEIRVFIERKCSEDVMDHAAFVFEKLGMQKTRLRNGVLFYLAADDRKFAILGDAGINALVPGNFWGDIKEKMRQHFSSGQFEEGLVTGIRMAGDALQKHFPFEPGDTNELSDEIRFQ